MEVTIRKVKAADDSYGTRRFATYGVYVNGTKVGEIVGEPGYMASSEWVVEDYMHSMPNGTPRRVAYAGTLAEAKAAAIRIWTR